MKLELIKFEQDNLKLEVTVSPLEETVWLSLDDMAALFGRDRSVIGKHVKNALAEECEKDSVWAKFARTGSDGKTYYVDYYNLDVIISVGYRVKSSNGIVFRKWANNVLREYLLKGYVVDANRTLITNDNYAALMNKVDSLDSRIERLEKDQNYFYKDQVIYGGRVFDALALINDLISRATMRIVLIDPYCDINTLNCFKGKADGVELEIITSSKARISQTDMALFNQQYGNLIVVHDENYHDRYIIIDDAYFYHLGASVNHLGKRFTQITLIEDDDIKNVLKSRV